MKLKLADLDKAQSLLLSGEVVAIPTETVYGLAGWIYSEAGLKKIFSTKARPFFDPLIVHVSGIDQARQLTSEWTEIHQALAQSCWPGPLTLIAPRNEKVNQLITSGLDSVGLRCPRHDLALKLLLKIEGGLAAPSANKFGKTSPTTSKHVFDEFGDEVSILEGGPCEVGIESTVAGVKGNQIEIYRPGFFTASMLEEILKQQGLKVKVSYAQNPVAPGQLEHHYMPKIPLVIVPCDFNWERDRQKIECKLNRKFIKPVVWHQPSDPRLASRELYEKLRSFDVNGHDLILTSQLIQHSSEEWLGIWNRLHKAKTLLITS